MTTFNDFSLFAILTGKPCVACPALAILKRQIFLTVAATPWQSLQTQQGMFRDSRGVPARCSHVIALTISTMGHGSVPSFASEVYISKQSCPTKILVSLADTSTIRKKILVIARIFVFCIKVNPV